MWVWYYYPRRNLRKSPKWQKTCIGPYLITKVLQPADAVLQKTRRSTPFVAHFDKLKPFYGDPPVDWRRRTPPTPPTEPAPEHDSGRVDVSPSKQATADSLSNPDEGTVRSTSSSTTSTSSRRLALRPKQHLSCDDVPTGPAACQRSSTTFVVATCRSDNGSSLPTHVHER